LPFSGAAPFDFKGAVLSCACSSGRPANGSRGESHLAANVHLPAAEVYPQDELPPCNKVELRGVKEVIRSFRRFTKSGDLRLSPPVRFAFTESWL
jgi:hypothetical protein